MAQVGKLAKKETTKPGIIAEQKYEISLCSWFHDFSRNQQILAILIGLDNLDTNLDIIVK